ncbi:MAG: double-strand break repair helicase AddA [Rhodobacterales bacterium]|nr:double-strand break repair helicase AddA [Rhodobacterales bacterium]
MKNRDEATQKQVLAAAPSASTWLSANAGSGKTRVLTDRVARLLLEGVEPQHILCLTYTKAAASEMQNRLFGRLGKWAMLRDASLLDELESLGVSGQIDTDALRNARTLFARAIEAPGGLKIQTIHSFCASLLRRFPLEAGVSPNFTEMDDRAGALLRAEIVESLATEHSEVIAGLARHITDEDFEKITSQIVRHRNNMPTDISKDDLWATFGIASGFDENDVTNSVFLGAESDLLSTLVSALKSGSAIDIKAAKTLGELGQLDLRALPVLESVFLFGAKAKSPFGAKIGSFPTKPTRAVIDDIIEDLNNLMGRVKTARESRLALAAAQKTLALHRFSQIFLPAYQNAKQLRGWLDFDDLILNTLHLLKDSSVAAWVLYRLDGGIDHVLIDEAQDTSPPQWGVIERLAQEFTSGAGARGDTLRTIFVVGDKKQSIYSFQGADPREFDRMRSEFSRRLINTKTPLQSLALQHSFRSAEAILRLVDQTFEGSEDAGFSKDQNHRAFKTEMPGRVDLWPVIDKQEDPEKDHWYDPVDRLGQSHHTVLLARRIAEEIDTMIARKVTIAAENEAGASFVQPGDFLILVQRRSALFQEIIRECKTRNLPIAGADRLKVGAEMAVKDIAALLSFLATPEDSLALAVALKSPMFGWDEQDLYNLAHKRDQKFLWQALRSRGDEFPLTMKIVDDLRNQVDFLRPFDLIERILTRHDGRKNLLARLGSEAEDGIDALLSQALAFERNAVPSLTGFLQWMETDDLEIKRQMDSSGNRIRVMTVHGAKGLESPIVILPDTARRSIQVNESLLDVDGVSVWNTSTDEAPKAIQKAKDFYITQQRAERDRLLYVAMTRAEKWLIVASSGDLGKDGSSWYDKIRVGMETSGAREFKYSFGSGLRLSNGNWDDLQALNESKTVSISPQLPDFLLNDAPAIPTAPKTLSPSSLGGAKALAGEVGLDEDAALRRGRQIHRLLEFLPNFPAKQWPDEAARLLATGPDQITGEDLNSILREARKVLSSQDLEHLFTTDALAEVSVTANIVELSGRRIHGAIDRLLITDNSILIVDFKSNAVVPKSAQDCPDGLLRQMGAYAAALANIYPDHKIETALLWTRTATLMPLPHDLVYQALCDTQLP